MKYRTLIHAALLSIYLVCPTMAEDKEKIAMLLDRSPSPANAIGYINVPSLNRLMKDAGFSSQATNTIEEVWFIADMDLAGLRPKWEAGYAVLKQPVDADRLAESLGGYVDTVENQKVVHSPQQTYFVPGTTHPERLGILRPTDRALLAGWLTPTLNIQYSPYLSAQANQPEAYLSFMMTVELKNLISPVPLAKRLEGLKSLQSNRPEAVAKILASIEGISVIVGRQSLQQFIVKFQFSKSPSSLNSIAPDMLAEILEKNGFAAPEVKTWKASTEGNELSLQGPVTQTTLSGLLSIFSLQSQAERVANRPSLADDKEKQIAYQSKHYFDEINSIIEQTRDHQSQTAGAMASWNDKRARQIDELTTLNVDPEMIQYGTNVAELLRGNALSVRQTNIEAGKIKANQGLDNGYYNDGSGYYNFNSSTDYQRVTDAMARGNAYGSYREALNQIDQMTAAVRREMTQKYQMQF
ncbi:hypothetical protein [Neorhodopirellula pilleata]|uniref:Uncharacterized protein n=1 Tax=Neorhodopirellula pilleata TaxID=2714738 RepID=A0A5C6APX7_9BACT|nr:hypothetical protein [Neorhodopirellula pilleata]TWU01588.1 hypothetical protein Pla100_13230 [Neorhodopirellula pilleata]